MRYGSKWPEYARQWDAMVINPSRRAEFQRLAQFALDHKAEYQEIEAATDVPWQLIAVIHRRESDADFTTYLGNGEPLSRKTKIEPEGRGPFGSFKEGAIDALTYDGLTKVIDWRLEKQIFYCERFNGPGYHNKRLPSAYVWGGTNIQRPGKYVADREWSPTTMDGQPGCAPLLWSIAQLDPSIRFVRETPPEADEPIILPPERPAMPEPALPSVEAFLEEAKAALRPVAERYVTGNQATAEQLKAELIKLLGGTPPSATALPPPVAAATPPVSPIVKPPAGGVVDKPSVQLSAIALAIATALQSTGVVGTPFGMGENPTDAGTLATLGPVLTGLVGATGGWGMVARMAMGALEAIAKKPPK